jgi:hypothetical protein
MTPRHIDHKSPEDQEMVHRRQQAELGVTDEYIVRTRAEDRSLLIRIGYVWDKYRPLIWLVGGALVALGFDFKTPAQTYKELSARIEAVKIENSRVAEEHAKENRATQAERDSIQLKLDVLIAVRCLDPKTRRELAVAQIDCSRYIETLRYR